MQKDLPEYQSSLVKGFISSALQRRQRQQKQIYTKTTAALLSQHQTPSSQSWLSQRLVVFFQGGVFCFWKDTLCPWGCFFDNPHLGRCHRFHQCRSLLRLFFLDRAPSLWDQHGVSWSFQMKLGKWAGWLASALRCTKQHCGEGAFARKSNKCNFLHELAVPHWLQKGSEGEQEKSHCL